MRRTDTLHLAAAALTHPGETGKNNEDSHAVVGYQLEVDGRPVVLAVVADGIGGHRAGEVASQIVVERVVAALERFDGGDPLPALRAALVGAGQAVARAAEQAPEREGMGSTVAVALVIERLLYIAAVGDSRIYLLQRGRLQQLTTDHTWVQEAIDHQLIAPEAARGHPHAHILRRHLGSRTEPRPDLRMRLAAGENDQQAEANQGHTLEPGDRLLLCSDGLTDLVSDEEIADHLARHAPEPAVAALTRLARARGGFDNITLVLLAVPEPPAARRPRRLGGWLALALLGLLLSVIALGLALGTYLPGWQISLLR